MIRRYVLEDIPEILVRVDEFLQCSPTYRDIEFSRLKTFGMLNNNLTNKSFFCDVAIDEDNKIVGGLAAQTCTYSFSEEAFAADILFYITESKRSLKLATGLVDSYIKWGKERRLREVRLASTTGIKSEKFNKLCEHLGFTMLGSIYSMEV